MRIPLGARWSFFAGAVIVLGGFVLGEKAYKNVFVHTLVEVADMKDNSCRKSNVAVGASCPDGCLLRPLAGPELSGRASECRSRLWVKTCGAECDARDGLIRTDDGYFFESDTFMIRLDNPPDRFKQSFAEMGIELEPSASGLWKYRASYNNPEDSIRVVEKMEKRLRAIPYVVSTERILK